MTACNKLELQGMGVLHWPTSTSSFVQISQMFEVLNCNTYIQLIHTYTQGKHTVISQAYSYSS